MIAKTEEQKRKAEYLNNYRMIYKYTVALNLTLKHYNNISCKFELLEELKNNEQELKAITAIINTVKDTELHQILIYRYIQGKTIEEIAEIMNYSDTTIKRRTIKALDSIDI